MVLSYKMKKTPSEVERAKRISLLANMLKTNIKTSAVNETPELFESQELLKYCYPTDFIGNKCDTLIVPRHKNVVIVTKVAAHEFETRKVGKPDVTGSSQCNNTETRVLNSLNLSIFFGCESLGVVFAVSVVHHDGFESDKVKLAVACHVEFCTYLIVRKMLVVLGMRGLVSDCHVINLLKLFCLEYTEVTMKMTFKSQIQKLL